MMTQGKIIFVYSYLLISVSLFTQNYDKFAILCTTCILSYHYESGAPSMIHFEFHPNPEGWFPPYFLLGEFSVDICMTLCKKYG